MKFKDAELIGVPTIVTVGRGLADGNVEVRDRRTGEREDVAGRRRRRAHRRDRPQLTRMAHARIEAVIFDWGGTLTRWHDVDFHAESVALAQAVRRTPSPDDDHHAHAERLHRAGDVIWGRSRDHQQSATIADLFTEAGSTTTPTCWPPTTSSGSRTRSPTPRCGRCGRSCARRG